LQPQCNTPNPYTQFTLKESLEEIKAQLNSTAKSLSAPWRARLARFPTFSLNASRPERPTLQLNIPRPDLNLRDLLPQLNFSKLTADTAATGAASLKVFNVPAQLAQMDDLHSLQGLFKAFNLQQQDGDDDDEGGEGGAQGGGRDGEAKVAAAGFA